MSDVQLDNEALPGTPVAGKSILYVDSTGKRFIHLDDGGFVRGSLAKNSSSASQGPGFAADTYLTNSDLLIPSPGLQAGMIFTWKVAASKTAAGIATPTFIIRIGANRSTADLAIITLTAGAQTAAADNGLLIVQAILRNSGAAAVMAAIAAWAKTQAGTAGLGGSIDGVSAAFDATGRAGQYVGLSVNGGASAAWTVTGVAAEVIG